MEKLCELLRNHYEKLAEELMKQKEELRCEPLCEDRHSNIRQLAITINVFYELIRALCD